MLRLQIQPQKLSGKILRKSVAVAVAVNVAYNTDVAAVDFAVNRREVYTLFDTRWQLTSDLSH